MLGYCITSMGWLDKDNYDKDNYDEFKLLASGLLEIKGHEKGFNKKGAWCRFQPIWCRTISMPSTNRNENMLLTILKNLKITCWQCLQLAGKNACNGNGSFFTITVTIVIITICFLLHFCPRYSLKNYYNTNKTRCHLKGLIFFLSSFYICHR